MKIPAIRSKIGDWTFYISTLSFNQVAQFVSSIDDELHKSESLKELIQRSITNNYLSIKDYIINQPELFFNSLVLAVYNDYPDWTSVEIKFDDFETHKIGLLNFPGKHKIFPLDGQHRVEGIKAAIKENPELGEQSIGVIFVGHKNDELGMRRSRRLFSTLNRYAKPVTMDDIIALDEDDSVAIITRNLLEEFELFEGNRVTKSKNKSIQDNDKDSFTSIITLYQCNRELLKLFRNKRKIDAPDPYRDKKGLEEYLKFRPHEVEITLFQEFCLNFWESFENTFLEVSDFKQKSEKGALKYRNKENGGNLLFRPIGLYPFVQASIEIQKRTGKTFQDIFSKLNKINFTLNQLPWKNIVWNNIEKTMIMGSSGLVKLILIYSFDNKILRVSEKTSLVFKYSSKLGLEQADPKTLDKLPKIG